MFTNGGSYGDNRFNNDFWKTSLKSQQTIFEYFQIQLSEGSGKGGLCPGILWAILWFLILWFLAWPIAFFIAWLYVLLIPFSACIEPLKGVCEAILKVVNLPLTCAENMIAMKPLCEYIEDKLNIESHKTFYKFKENKENVSEDENENKDQELGLKDINEDAKENKD
ncbi:hypothetical protein KUTeg_019830 [Tegillarca granosa]|uniref:Caveolin n=1 Tax=Tegillarca granosa TaxID=220873 RepID=A0ABQ9EFN4_TEGGR|nr:hypothetical protein KUTeg_019830 [Tegillarca granosa]